MFGYRVPAPDDAMLISGGRSGKDGAPFRVVVGHGAFVLPGFRKARYLTLAMQEAEVSEPCVTQQGLAVKVDAVVAFKVPSDSESIVNAGQRFLSDERSMPMLTGRIFAGHLRSIVGSMKLEEIITNRQRLAEEVLDQSKEEMAKLGLIVDSFQISSVSEGSGYIDAMAAPHRAAIQQAAKIAQANADQAAEQAQQESQRKQISYKQETAVTQAQATRDVQKAQAQADAEVDQAKAAAAQAVQLAQTAAGKAANVAAAQAKAEIDKQQATAGQAGPLAQAQAQLEVTARQTDLARQQAELRQQQLAIEVVKPAEADAQKVKITAHAEAERQTTLAAAAASNNKIALEQALIENLPLVVEAAAGALKGSNVTVLNGAEGVSEILTKVVGQGLGIYETLKNGLLSSNGGKPAELTRR